MQSFFGPVLHTALGLEKAHLRHALKTGLASVLALVLSTALGFTQGLWAVVTVAIVMQARLGGSLRVGWTRFLGTFMGAVIAAFFGSLAGQSHLGLVAALFCASAVTAYLAFAHESFRMAGVTAAIILLFEHATGVQASHLWLIGAERVGEISLGIACALVVSFSLWPARAREDLRAGVSLALDRTASLLLAIEFCRMHGDSQALQGLRHEVHQAVAKNNLLINEARNEPGGTGGSTGMLVSLANFAQRLSEHVISMEHVCHIEDVFVPIDGVVEPELSELGQACARNMHLMAEAVRQRKPYRVDVGPELKAVEARLRNMSDDKGMHFSFQELSRFFTYYSNLHEVVAELHGMSVRVGQSADPAPRKGWPWRLKDLAELKR